MKNKGLKLYGVTTRNRHEVTWCVKELIRKTGGYVIDFYQFSNMAVCFNFEISPKNAEQLFASLIDESILDQKSLDLVTDMRNRKRIESTGTDTTIAGSLHIEFVTAD